MTSLKGKEILIVDDAADARMLTRKILEVDGATVTEAETVEQAFLTTKTLVPHLILIDLDMPGKNGFDFLESRMADPVFRGIPALVLSGLKDRESVRRAVSLGADDYILKPLRAALVLQKVRKVLRLGSFLSRTVVPGPGAQAVFSIPTEIARMNETGCVVECPVKFGPDEGVTIHSDLLQELGIVDAKMRTRKAKGQYLEAGQYSTEINFVALEREVANRIRAKIGGRK